MQDHAIFFPMGALVALTTIIALATAGARAVAIRRGEVSEDLYRLFQGSDRPELEAKLSRHYGNLLELPILYYVAGVGIFAAGVVDEFFVILFWAYVFVRVVHAGIHLSWNRPIHRAVVFGIGFVLVAVIWGRFLAVLPAS